MVRDGKPTSYTIIIDEAQREALLGILKGVMGECTVAVPEALEYWIPMLDDLPKEELEHPNILHGFCL